jgi:hypothetical protein
MDEMDEDGEGRDDDGHKGLEHANIDEDGLAISPTRETHRARYLHLFDLGKQFAQNGSTAKRLARGRYE